VKRVDSMRRKEIAANAPRETVTLPGNPVPVTRVSFPFAPIVQNFSTELNNHAFTIYTFTKDPFYTDKALAFSKRSLEFYESPPSIDTYARLLYRAGKNEEAIQWLEKALALIRDKKAPPFPNNYPEMITKIKAGEPLPEAH